MNTSPQPNPENQEIDLSQIPKRIGRAFEDFSTWIFRGFLFIKRNLIVLAILFIIGAGLGYYLDKSSTVYDSEIIVTPNFGSNDYLYSKITSLNSKISENDTAYLFKLGFKDTKSIGQIEIEPIIDIYKFIDNKAENFELIKLMAEDGDLNKIVEDKITSKNYPYHLLKISTSKKINDETLIKPLLDYLNDSDYYKTLQKVIQNNSEVKARENDSIINQIDGFLNDFKKNTNGTKSSNLVYYNENTQLNDIIKTKEGLLQEQGTHRIEKINIDKIIKDVSVVTNIKNNTGANNKMKFILPVLFILIFLLLAALKAFYNKQLEKSKL